MYDNSLFILSTVFPGGVLQQINVTPLDHKINFEYKSTSVSVVSKFVLHFFVLFIRVQRNGGKKCAVFIVNQSVSGCRPWIIFSAFAPAFLGISLLFLCKHCFVFRRPDD